MEGNGDWATELIRDAKVAIGEDLDAIGEAWKVVREPGEADSSYRDRVLAVLDFRHDRLVIDGVELEPQGETEAWRVVHPGPPAVICTLTFQLAGPTDSFKVGDPVTDGDRRVGHVQSTDGRLVIAYTDMEYVRRAILPGLVPVSR